MTVTFSARLEQAYVSAWRSINRSTWWAADFEERIRAAFNGDAVLRNYIEQVIDSIKGSYGKLTREHSARNNTFYGTFLGALLAPSMKSVWAYIYVEGPAKPGPIDRVITVRLPTLLKTSSDRLIQVLQIAGKWLGRRIWLDVQKGKVVIVLPLNKALKRSERVEVKLLPGTQQVPCVTLADLDRARRGLVPHKLIVETAVAPSQVSPTYRPIAAILAVIDNSSDTAYELVDLGFGVLKISSGALIYRFTCSVNLQSSCWPEGKPLVVFFLRPHHDGTNLVDGYYLGSVNVGCKRIVQQDLFKPGKPGFPLKFRGSEIVQLIKSQGRLDHRVTKRLTNEIAHELRKRADDKFYEAWTLLQGQAGKVGARYVTKQDVVVHLLSNEFRDEIFPINDNNNVAAILRLLYPSEAAAWTQAA